MNFERKIRITNLNLQSPIDSEFVVVQEMDNLPFPKKLNEFSYQHEDKVIKILFHTEHTYRRNHTEVSFSVETLDGNPTTFDNLADTSLIFDVMKAGGDYLLIVIGEYLGPICYRTKSALKHQSYQRNSIQRGYLLKNLEEITEP